MYYQPALERISITAFFPAYNDEHTIEGIIRTSADEMRRVTDDFEVVVVDDGSKDSTGALLDRLASELPYLRVIHHERNLGYGAALISGLTTQRKISSSTRTVMDSTTCGKCISCLPNSGQTSIW